MEASNINNKLPSELLSIIFSFLEPKELRLTAEVCNLWKSISESSILWRLHSRQRYGKDFLASVGNPDPKVAMALSHKLKTYEYRLRQLPKTEVNVRGISLCGSLLCVSSMGAKKFEIYDLSKGEILLLPEFMNLPLSSSFNFFKLILSGSIPSIVLQVSDRMGGENLIFSKYPFDKHDVYINSMQPFDVVGDLIYSKNSTQISVMNLHDGEEEYRLEFESPIMLAAVSERYCSAVLENKKVFICDLLKKRNVVKDYSSSGDQFHSLILLDNLQILVDTAGGLMIWDLDTEKLVGNFTGLENPTKFTLCKDFLFWESYTEEGQVNLFRMSLKQESSITEIELFLSDTFIIFGVDNKLFYVREDEKDKIYYIDNESVHRFNLKTSTSSYFAVNARYCAVSKEKNVSYCDLMELFTSKKHSLPMGEDNRPLKVPKLELQ